MTTLREAAEIALDVLEDSCYPRASMRDFNRYDDTIETLRKALANHSERDLDMVAAPPQRKPLTDEQLRDIREHQRLIEELGPVWAPTLYYFCQAIERAHGIRGEV